MGSNTSFDIKTLETEMVKKSLKLEKELALEALNKISGLFTEDIIMVDGVQYKKIVKAKKVTISRVTVTWERPVY